MRLEDAAGKLQTVYRMGEPLVIVVRALFSKEIKDPIFGLNILTEGGILVADCRSSHYRVKTGRTKGMVEYRVRIDSLSLYPRTYVVEPWVKDFADLYEYDWVRDAAEFVVTSGPEFLAGAIVSGDHGIAFVQTSWEFSQVGEAAAE